MKVKAVKSGLFKMYGEKTNQIVEAEGMEKDGRRGGTCKFTSREKME